MIRPFVLAAVSVIALSAAAYAADMYVPSSVDPGPGGYKDSPWTPNWAGFYLGVNGGYGLSQDTNDSIFVTHGLISPKLSQVSPSGGSGGGQIGYNFQQGRVVYGVEADFEGSGIKDDALTSYPAGVSNYRHFTYKSSLDVNWFGTVRGRLGYAWNSSLIYVTGGFAYGEVEYNGFYNESPNSASLHKNEVDTGWTIGGGVEHKLTPNWSIKGEYQFIDLSSQSLSGIFTPVVGYTATTKFDEQFSTVRVGFNYHIGTTHEPLK